MSHLGFFPAALQIMVVVVLGGQCFIRYITHFKANFYFLTQVVIVIDITRSGFVVCICASNPNPVNNTEFGVI